MCRRRCSWESRRLPSRLAGGWRGAKFSPPKTPWGHPDLQGIYSNDDETGTPMERPAQFEGKTLPTSRREELAKIVKERNEQFVERERAPSSPEACGRPRT